MSPLNQCTFVTHIDVGMQVPLTDQCSQGQQCVPVPPAPLQFCLLAAHLPEPRHAAHSIPLCSFVSM